MSKAEQKSKAIYTIAAKKLGISQSWVSKIMNGYASLDTPRVLAAVQETLEEIRAEEQRLEDLRLSVLQQVDSYKEQHRELNKKINSMNKPLKVEFNEQQLIILSKLLHNQQQNWDSQMYDECRYITGIIRNALEGE